MPMLSNRWRESKHGFLFYYYGSTLNLGARFVASKEKKATKTRGRKRMVFRQGRVSGGDEPAIRQLPRNIASYA